MFDNGTLVGIALAQLNILVVKAHVVILHGSGSHLQIRGARLVLDIRRGREHLVHALKAGSFVILFTIAPVLALAMAVVTAAFAVIMFWQNMRMREVFSDNRKKISGINAQLQDSLAGMRVVKSFANEETERFKFRASNNRYLSSKENMYHAMGVYTATYGLLSGVLYVIVVLLGGWLVAQGQLQAVDMATFALYISLFCTPLETLVNSAETYQKAIAGFKRMDEVLSTAPDIQDKPGDGKENHKRADNLDAADDDPLGHVVRRLADIEQVVDHAAHHVARAVAVT